VSPVAYDYDHENSLGLNHLLELVFNILLRNRIGPVPLERSASSSYVASLNKPTRALFYSEHGEGENNGNREEAGERDLVTGGRSQCHVERHNEDDTNDSLLRSLLV
jgi:hypothetical protein